MNATGSTSGHASSTLPAAGRPPTASGVIDPLIAEVIDDDPRESGYRSTNWTAALLVRVPEARPWHRGLSEERRAWRSNACESGGSGLGISWPCARRPGGSQKGAETRPEGPRPHRVADARRDDHHRDAAALLVLRPHRRAGPRADHRQPLQAASSTGRSTFRSGDVALLITEEWIKETHQTFLAMIRSHWRGWNIVLVRGSGLAAQVAGEPARGPSSWGSRSGLLPRATPELNAMDHLWRHTKRETVGEPGDRDGRPIGPRCVPVHHRPQPARPTAASGRPLGRLLADEIAGLSKNFLLPT